jgi:hypothetical protein
MTISEKLLEIMDYTGAGYRPVIDYHAWRVAVLNFCDDLLPENLTKMQRHNETDEVFVLLRGRCILFLGEGDKEITSIHAEDMSLFKIYNVKRAAWHTHTLSRDAMVLIVENRDTTYDNSPFCTLTDNQQQEIIQLTRILWNQD